MVIGYGFNNAENSDSHSYSVTFRRSVAILFIARMRFMTR